LSRARRGFAILDQAQAIGAAHHFVGLGLARYPTGEGLDELLRRIDVALPVDPVVKLSLHMPLTEGRSLALIHALGRVVTSRINDSHMDLEAEIPEAVVRRLKLKDFEAKETLRPSASYG